ncbi:MAG: general secretion pathway protein GspK [Candidatus Levyibacteriota bacterium]
MATTARHRSSRRAQSGIALVMALWLAVLLTVIASGFAFSMRSEALAARNAVSLAQARAAADGAVERTAFELMRPRMVGTWTFDGQPHAWKDGDASIVASATDEGSRIDINAAPDALIKSLLMNVGGMDDAAASALVDAIGDWRDPDDLRRPNGAEAPEYLAANLKYGPANAPFETIGEVSRVLGMKPEVFQRIRRAITVYSRQPGINAATAGRSVLLALPNATPEAVDAFLAQRGQAVAQGLPAPPFGPAQAFIGAAVPVWRIRAEATMPDGVTFAREAVVRPSSDPRRPLTTLAWLDAPRASSAVSQASVAKDASQ